jgi:hypothetical protein
MVYQSKRLVDTYQDKSHQLLRSTQSVLCTGSALVHNHLKACRGFAEGDWRDCQKFKGLPGTEGTLKVAAVKPGKIVAYEAAMKAAAAEPAEGATTLKKKAQEKLCS